MLSTCARGFVAEAGSHLQNCQQLAQAGPGSSVCPFPFLTPLQFCLTVSMLGSRFPSYCLLVGAAAAPTHLTLLLLHPSKTRNNPQC